ncbi:MAG: hypothetical protein Q8O14_10070 [bacterium]|nr:hypothetical protein [bacterium]
MRGLGPARRIPIVLGPLLAVPGLLLALAGTARGESLRLLALRVDFQPDTLETTTGDGRFESAFQFSRRWTIDPLPHDSLYFDSHLRFLSHWYGRASQGGLDLEWEIWPRGGQAAYRLPHPMWHYHWNQSRDRTDEQLAELFRHSLEAADADPALAFFNEAGERRFHSVIIFHAGVGQDFGEDDTPHDIPSAWLGALDGQTMPHETTVGDETTGLSWTVRQGLILPEGENHENYQHGLAGLLVLQFGHELGLPNLYDGRTGRSVIGKWGLMDQGSANYSGLLPAPLDAWSRLHLGWGSVEVVAAARDSVQVAAPDGPALLPRMVRIPLNDDEYYLVEYRRRQEEGRNWTWARDRAGRWARLDSSFTISFQDTLGQPGDSTGVFIEAGNLDFDLPGSGLLVWHVDERAATPEAIAANTVNDDPRRRGVDLVEGDGVQDIGRDYGFFSMRGSVALGGNEDPWQQPNTGWTLANPHYSYRNVSLAWDTEPPTSTNDGLFTGLRLDGFSGPDGQGVWPDHGRFNLSWDLRPAAHGLSLTPPLEGTAAVDVMLQAFCWPEDGESLAACVALRDGLGRSYGRVLGGDLATWPRADGHASLLPTDWQDGLDGLWALEDGGEARLLAWRGDSLALFRPMGLPRLFTTERFWAGEQGIQAVLPTGGGAPAAGDPWRGRQPGLFVVSGQMLLRLDPAALTVVQVLGSVPAGELRLVEVEDDSGYPGLLVKGDHPRVYLAGRNVLGEGGTLPAGADLLALDAVWEARVPESTDTLEATALLRDEDGASLFRGSRLLRRLDCPNLSVRPLQFGPDPGLELAFQLPGGGLRIYSQAGTLLAQLALEDGHGAPLTGSRTDEGGLAVMAASSDRLSGLEAAGLAPPTWPRIMPPLVDGPLLLPELGLVLGLRRDGRLAAWEAELDHPVWTQRRGLDGRGRPWSSGATHQEAVRIVRENPAFVWPNPASTVAHLRFLLGAPARVTLHAYDTAGDRVASLGASFDRAGEHELSWDLRGVAPGAYFCLLQAEGGESWTRRVKLAVIR